MKRNHNHRNRLLSLLILAGGIFPDQARSMDAHFPEKTSHQADSIIIQKNLNNKKHSVNLYTNASQQVLFFTTNGEEGRTYQLLLFRQQGKLIKQSRIRNRETTVVSKPEKGNYYFEVFLDKEKIESGTIVVQ